MMILRNTVLFVCAALLGLGTVSCKEERITRADVILTLDSLEHKFEWLDYRLAREEWELHATGRSDSLEFFRGLYDYVVSDSRALRNLEQGHPYITDELNKRRLELIEARVVLGRLEAAREIEQLRDSLISVDYRFQPQFDGEIQTPASLSGIIAGDPDRVRREQAFQAYHAIGEELADGLARLIRLRNQEVRKLGYNDYYALAFARRGMDVREYLQLLNRIDTLTAEPYRALLSRLQEQLGVAQLEEWDLAYAHRDVERQAERYFPADWQMALIDTTLRGLGFDLDKLPIYTYLRSESVGPELAYAFAVRPPHDVRVLAQLSGGFDGVQSMTHALGEALYAAHIAQDEALFAYAIPDAWRQGLANTLASLCEQEQWLKTYPGMPPRQAERLSTARREQGLVSIRRLLLRLVFEYQAYLNPNRDLNRLYWDLFEQYMMLPRHEDLKPWATTRQYMTHPVQLQDQLYAKIIAAQNIAAVDQLYGRAIENPSMKAFLVQNYFRFGSRYDWRDLLERGTGEKLNPAFLTRQLGI